MSDSALHLPRSFSRLAWSNLAAQSAEQIALAAAPIVAVLALGAGTGETGLLQTVLTLPFIVFAIPAGLMADRLSRRQLMVGAEALRAASLLAIVALAQLGLLTWPMLALLGFIAVCGTVVFSVAAPALVPALVPAPMLSSANTRIELARTLAFAAGPALGGAIVGWSGTGAAFAAASLLSLVAVALLRGLDEPPRTLPPRRHPLHDIREGAAFMFRHRLLAPVFATQFVFNAAFFMLLAIFVPYAVHHLGLSASAVGLTLAMMGAGMIAGALLAPTILGRLPFGTVIALGPLAGVGAAIVMALTISWPTPLLAGASLFLFGFGPILWVISTTTLRQSVTPREILGRVFAINLMGYGARPVGAGLGALIAGFYGVEACLLAAVALFAVQALVIVLSPVIRLRQQPDMAGDQICLRSWTKPERVAAASVSS
jgi:predicted MFS family arabinose efflux permease